MVFQQQMDAEPSAFSVIPMAVSQAASRYQRFREVEQEQLARMARHSLVDGWTEESRGTLLDARERIREVCAARDVFRQQVREFVWALRAAGESLPMVLRQTRAMVHLLERSGVIACDDGWLEAEVLEWAIEEFSDVS
jgi:hypothetical protein